MKSEQEEPPDAALPTRTSEPVSAQQAPDARSSAQAVPAGPTQVRDPSRYDVVGEHGRGGLGRVSRAYDHELGRDIAIKELMSRGHVNELRFSREVLITARLEHPGIVPIYEAGRWPDGTPYYAMKLVSGRSLRELIAERPTVSERIGLLHHVIAVADAIAYAHDRRIIHRDLKPANVIAGDFGETIVIDWGLAKDLSVREEPAIGEGPFRTSDNAELTSAGAVLGTPAYMAPEQQRGEPVDQRADVFAIGAMLWELCALQRIPPADRGERRAILRRSGIDQDLASIIDKAVDPDPGRRYPDAGALAADLKAFKSGARIAARAYSLPAMLAHWTRRHRALAVSIAAGAVIATAAGIFYVHNIAIERDRADRERTEAQAQRTQADRANAALTLQHAQLLLRSDPTAAVETLASYRGSDTQAVGLTRARANALGVAILKASPHSGRAVLMQSLASGELLTVGDQTVAKTTTAGQTRVIARRVSPQRDAAYAASRHLLAYVCDPGAICLFDVAAEASRPVSPEMSSFAPARLAFSPDRRLLAAMSTTGAVAVWEIRDDGLPVLRYRGDVEHGDSIRFADDSTLVATTRSQVRVLHLASDGSIAPVQATDVRDPGSVRFSADRTLLAIATAAGSLRVQQLRTGVVTSSANLCKGALNSITFLPNRSQIAYICQDGDAGTWDWQRGTSAILAHVPGGGNIVSASEDGRYILLGGNAGVVLVDDLDTSIISTYLGHTERITSLLPPTASFPYIATGDSSGALRIWPLPRSAARVAMQSKTRLLSATLVTDDGPLLTVGMNAALSWWSFDGSAGELRDHALDHMQIAGSRGGARFAMYLLDPVVELWSFDGTFTRRVVETGHASVTAVRYFDDETFLTAGRDGSVQLWSADAEQHREIARVPEAIEFVLVQPHTHNFLVQGTSGALWRFDGTGTSPFVPATDKVVRYVFSRDGGWLAVATRDRALRLYDAKTWSLRGQLPVPESIKNLDFSSSGEQLAVTLPSAVHLLPVGHIVGGGTLADLPPDAGWREIDLPVGSAVFSDDGKWLGMTGEAGALWFYSITRKQWRCEIVSGGKLLTGYFSRDSRHFVATDTDGRVVIVDMTKEVW